MRSGVQDMNTCETVVTLVWGLNMLDRARRVPGPPTGQRTRQAYSTHSTERAENNTADTITTEAHAHEEIGRAGGPHKRPKTRCDSRVARVAMRLLLISQRAGTCARTARAHTHNDCPPFTDRSAHPPPKAGRVRRQKLPKALRTAKGQSSHTMA